VGDKPIYIKELYVPHLTDVDANVRAVSVFSLGMHGSPDHVPQIVPLLKDPDRHVRISAARALQRLHNPAAVDGLLEAIDPREEDTDVRAEAADALGQYAEVRVLDKLIAALDDPQLIVNRTAIRSLKTLTGQELPDDRLAWTKWEQSATAPFAGQRAYVYPVFSREKSWLEYIPFVPDPPNETPGQPAGMQAIRTEP
jgi:HEAT repeat protein